MNYNDNNGCWNYLLDGWHFVCGSFNYSKLLILHVFLSCVVSFQITKPWKIDYIPSQKILVGILHHKNIFTWKFKTQTFNNANISRCTVYSHIKLTCCTIILCTFLHYICMSYTIITLAPLWIVEEMNKCWEADEQIAFTARSQWFVGNGSTFIWFSIAITEVHKACIVIIQGEESSCDTMNKEDLNF